MVYGIPMVENYGNGFYKITTVSTTVSTTTPTVTTRFLHTLPTLGLSQVLHRVSTENRASRHVLRVPEFTPRRFALSLLIVQSLTREFLSTPQET